MEPLKELVARGDIGAIREKVKEEKSKERNVFDKYNFELNDPVCLAIELNKANIVQLFLDEKLVNPFSVSSCPQRAKTLYFLIIISVKPNL